MYISKRYMEDIYYESFGSTIKKTGRDVIRQTVVALSAGAIIMLLGNTLKAILGIMESRKLMKILQDEYDNAETEKDKNRIKSNILVLEEKIREYKNPKGILNRFLNKMGEEGLKSIIKGSEDALRYALDNALFES